MKTEVRIGTSGWHYQHWRGPFYPERFPSSKMLPYYVQHFDTVEINNSFYKLPSPETFREWRDATPDGFQFAVKASRFITHNKKLKDPEHALDHFLPRALELGGKLGPVLFQLPPRWRINVERLEQFLSVLPRGRRLRYAFECTGTYTVNPDCTMSAEIVTAVFGTLHESGVITGVGVNQQFHNVITDFGWVFLDEARQQ